MKKIYSAYCIWNSRTKYFDHKPVFKDIVGAFKITKSDLQNYKLTKSNYKESFEINSHKLHGEVK